MRARRLAAVALDDAPPVEDAAGACPEDEAPAGDPPEDARPLPRFCLACGAEDCREHHEMARLDAPSRAVHDATLRLQRAAAEQRAAARALRMLVLSEVARDRGELETAPAPQPEPCPRCLIRDAEAAAAEGGAPKPAARRAKRGNGQQALPFKDW
jgi:hypothetical protein